eukprot:553216_1
MGCCGSASTDDIDNDFLLQEKLPNINKSPTHIILMGDSVLDNFYWLEDKTLDVEQQCWNTFGDKIKVTNVAVDETQTIHVLKGIIPNFTYRRAREKENMSPYPITYDSDDQKSGGAVYPLKLMQKYISNGDININVDLKTQIKPTIVLSVGGNDGRIHLGKLGKITGGANDVINALKKDKFVENYNEIVDKLVNEFKMNVILVFVYQIQNKHMIYGYKSKVKELLKAMNFGFSEMCKVAQKYKLPMIDLSRTFDPSNEQHYGISPIEPSNISGQFIVDLVQFILEKYDFDNSARESLVFYGLKNKNITIEKNTKAYINQNVYLKSIQARNEKLKLI